MKDLQILSSLFASCKLEDPKGSLKSTRSKLDDIGETLNKFFNPSATIAVCHNARFHRCLIARVVMSISDRRICLKYFRLLRFAMCDYFSVGF